MDAFLNNFVTIQYWLKPMSIFEPAFQGTLWYIHN